jgi:long-chain acyl-CoA synthetase
MNLANIFEDGVRKYGEYEMCHWDGKWYTNLEMNRMANRLGNGLKKLGIGRGDRIVTKLSNCVEILVAFNAIYRIGAVIIPMVPNLRQEQAAFIFGDSGARAVITSSDHLPSIRAAQKDAPSLKHVILVDNDGTPDTIYFHNLLTENSDVLQIADMDCDELAALIYTSGTTGNPKGVMHTHFSLYLINTSQSYRHLTQASITLQNTARAMPAGEYKYTESAQKVTGMDRNLIYLVVLPLSHVMGIMSLGFQNLNGTRYVVLKGWNPVTVLKTIQDFRIGNIALVPTMYVQLLDYPDFARYDISSLRICSTGGARLEPEIGLKWKEKTGLHIHEGWGMTETGSGVTNNPYDRPPKYGSVGVKISECNTMGILDNDDKLLPDGQAGEICVKGPALMKGYWNLPDETAKVFKNGWLHTGDVGYRDPDGYYYITDRKKDLIIRGGENVTPKEVEEVICKYQKVADAACVGIPDRVYGEEIKAFVVLKPGERCTEVEIIEHCTAYLPKFKMPKQVQFIEAIPRNAMGKILRTELRKQG